MKKVLPLSAILSAAILLATGCDPYPLPLAAQPSARQDCDAYALATKVVEGPFTDCISLQNSRVRVVVCPKHARIVAFNLVGAPESNLLWSNPVAGDPEDKKHWGMWENWGGDKIWPWPQDDWKSIQGEKWPPPAEADIGPFDVDCRPDGTLRMVSPVLRLWGVRIVRELKLVPGKAEMDVRSFFEAPDGKPTSAAKGTPWSITQVDMPDDVVFYARVANPEAPWELSDDGSAMFDTKPNRIGRTGVVRIDLSPSDPKRPSQKSTTMGDVLAVASRGYLFSIRNFSPPAPQPAHTMQVYFSRGDVTKNLPKGCHPYAELEFATGSDTATGSPHVLVQRWSLDPLPAGKDRDAAVARIIGRK